MIISVREVAHPRESFVSQLSRRGYVRAFVVTTDSAYTEQIQVQFAIDPATGVYIPRPYQYYQTATTYDTKALVRMVSARQRDNTRLVWDVVVEYDTEFEPFENPFTEPPEITFTSETYEQPLPGRAATFYDTGTPSSQSEDPNEAGQQQLVAWGKGVTTSAGEPFDPPPVMTRARPIVKYGVNLPLFTMAAKVKYENSVNKTAWNGLQPRQAWLRSIEVSYHRWQDSSTTTPDIYFARVNFTWALKAETWDLLILDIGSYYLDWSTGTAVRKAFEVEGTGEKRLGLLDHSVDTQLGKKLAEGQDPQFLRFRAYREEEFNDLGINLNLALELLRTKRRKN